MALIEFVALERRKLGMTTTEPKTVGEVLGALMVDAEFRAEWNAALAEVPFDAYRWETPRLSLESLDDPFEAVVVEDVRLRRPQNPDAFAEHFEDGSDVLVLTLPNLSGDATLVVPTPLVYADCYCHLGEFVRGAPMAQQDALWQRTAETALERCADAPLWLSTAGGGVPWLHVRMDKSPKYYAHAPYRCSSGR